MELRSDTSLLGRYDSRISVSDRKRSRAVTFPYLQFFGLLGKFELKVLDKSGGFFPRRRRFVIYLQFASNLVRRRLQTGSLSPYLRFGIGIVKNDLVGIEFRSTERSRVERQALGGLKVQNLHDQNSIVFTVLVILVSLHQD